MTNAPSLRPGDRVPDFALPGLDGKLRKLIWSFTGDPVALIAVDDLGNLDGAHFSALIAACKTASAIPVVVAGNKIAAATTAWTKLGGSAEHPLLLCDPDGKFLPALLSQAGMGFGQGGGLRMRVIVLDPNQRVAATFDSRALPAAAEAIGALAASVRSDGGADQLLHTPMAPVLVLPRVFEPDFCTQLIRLWGKGDHKDSGVSSRYGNVNVEAPEADRGLHRRRADPAEGDLRSPGLSHRPGAHQGLRLRPPVHLRFPRRAVLQRGGKAFLRRPSRQRCADHRRPSLRRVAQPQ